LPSPEHAESSQKRHEKGGALTTTYLDDEEMNGKEAREKKGD